MTEKLKKCLFNKEFETITKQGCISYINSYIETMQDRIAQGDLRKPLYEERVLFFTKAIEFLKAADENPPLTLDELRQMNGEPVWCEAMQEWRTVCIGCENDVRLYSILNTISAKHVLNNNGLVYRRKPEA